MPVCLELKEIVEMNRPAISELENLGLKYGNQDTVDACKAFSQQVRLVEAFLVHTYAIVAKLARKVEDPKEIAGLWKTMGEVCNSVLQTLQNLKARFPNCGTSELYDLALDYKLACDERHRDVEQEIACQQVKMPEGLLPKTS